jgi:hypothetical protein
VALVEAWGKDRLPQTRFNAFNIDRIFSFAQSPIKQI